jgi:hypothetical protein
MPKVTTPTTRWRHSRTRRDEYLRRIDSEPDDRQALIISSMIDAEWNAYVCEIKAHEADPATAAKMLRLAAEWRRQLLLLDRDLDLTCRRSLEPSSERPKTLAEHLAAKDVARR